MESNRHVPPQNLESEMAVLGSATDHQDAQNAPQTIIEAHGILTPAPKEGTA